MARTTYLWRVGIASCAAFVVSIPRPARAVDPFEIEVYDGTANQPGVPSLELHANSVASGLRTSAAPELPPNHQSHFTLEPSLGLLPWWEIGGYLQTALRADGTFDYAGTKLRSKFVTSPSFSEHVRFGANLEVSLLPQHYDRNRWGMELRPIAAYEDKHWLLAFNPIVDLRARGSRPTPRPILAACCHGGLQAFRGRFRRRRILRKSRSVFWLHTSARTRTLHL